MQKCKLADLARFAVCGAISPAIGRIRVGPLRRSGPHTWACAFVHLVFPELRIESTATIPAMKPVNRSAISRMVAGAILNPSKAICAITIELIAALHVNATTNSIFLRIFSIPRSCTRLAPFSTPALNHSEIDVKCPPKLGQPVLEFSGFLTHAGGGADEPFNSDIGALLPIALCGRTSF
jgi:hypothetical protein